MPVIKDRVDDAVLHCIDFRFRPEISEWINDNLNNRTDEIAIAGASKAIVDPESQKSLINQIALTQRLHGVKTLHVIDHIDCGAYGGSAHYTDRDHEVDAHRTCLHEATELIKHHFPGLLVKTYLADFQLIRPIE
jgi:carbonic anhydrase